MLRRRSSGNHVDISEGRDAYQVTLDGGVDDLCQHVLVREAHDKPVLG